MHSHALVPISQLRDHIVSSGVGSVTLDDVMGYTGLTRAQATKAMKRYQNHGHYFSPSKGLYIPIPSEFTAWGVVPAMDFIDQLMKHVNRPYYVALLSAAEQHGASHQRPQVFQVMVDKPLRNRDIHRVRLRFYWNSRLADIPVVLRNSRTSQVPISTPEATVFDLVSRPKAAAALYNAATIIGDLTSDNNLNPEKLASVAPLYPLSVVRRTGWLLDRVAEFEDTSALSQSLWEFLNLRNKKDRREVDLLDSRGKRQGSVNTKWGIIENTEVEPDL